MILGYREAMAEMTSQCIKNRYIAGVEIFVGEDPSLAQVNLLPPPRIETIDLVIYEGHVDDLIVLGTSDDFGIGNIRVIIQDENGIVIESGDATPWPDYSGFWDYMTTASVPSGTSVVVSAVATNMLGALGTCSERIVIP
jgi:hypothetical protein